MLLLSMHIYAIACTLYPHELLAHMQRATIHGGNEYETLKRINAANISDVKNNYLPFYLLIFYREIEILRVLDAGGHAQTPPNEPITPQTSFKTQRPQWNSKLKNPALGDKYLNMSLWTLK